MHAIAIIFGIASGAYRRRSGIVRTRRIIEKLGGSGMSAVRPRG